MKQPKPRILVVEDDAALLQGLCDVFAFNGYDPKGVEDGGMGLEAGLDSEFDLIILDVMLPTMDGFTICKEIRKKKPGQGIIIITAKGSEGSSTTTFPTFRVPPVLFFTSIASPSYPPLKAFADISPSADTRNRVSMTGGVVVVKESFPYSSE